MLPLPPAPSTIYGVMTMCRAPAKVLYMRHFICQHSSAVCGKAGVPSYS